MGKAMGKAHRCCVLRVLGEAQVPSIPWSGDGLTCELTAEGEVPDDAGDPGALEIFTIKPWANGRNFHRFSREISCVSEVRRI